MQAVALLSGLQCLGTGDGYRFTHPGSGYSFQLADVVPSPDEGLAHMEVEYQLVQKGTAAEVRP